MKIYITRHGQVVSKGIDGNVQYPAGDPPLSQLGRAQAARLGKQLNHFGFHGKLYTSPYARAMETAQIIADYTGSLIVPWAPMREVVRSYSAMDVFRGLTLEELREKFPSVDPEATLAYPWWTKELESNEDVEARLRAGLEELNPQEDIMLVGHGASSYCACEALGMKLSGDGYNCSYTCYDTEDKSNCKRMDPGHLPYRMRTFNTIYQYQEDAKIVEEFMAQGLEIPEEIKQTEDCKLLHIGDTHSAFYPYYQKLIEEVRPNIIIHTGDFADEIKVGRCLDLEEEYTQTVDKLAQILKNSGAEKIYLVPGNNDVPEILEKLMPFAQLVKPNSVVDIEGISCTLGHACTETNAPAQWSFYGHGLTGETWKPEMNNLQEGICRFNVIKGISVILLPQRKQFRFFTTGLYHWGRI